MKSKARRQMSDSCPEVEILAVFCLLQSSEKLPEKKTVLKLHAASGHI